MKKIIKTVGIILTLLILWQFWKFYYSTQVHEVHIFNKTKSHIDSITIYTNKPNKLNNSLLKAGENRDFELDISDYKVREGVFFIKIYQGNYYINSAFNYHDGWMMLPESNIYVYEDFISPIELKNVIPPPNNTSQKFRIK